MKVQNTEIIASSIYSDRNKEFVRLLMKEGRIQFLVPSICVPYRDTGVHNTIMYCGQQVIKGVIVDPALPSERMKKILTDLKQEKVKIVVVVNGELFNEIIEFTKELCELGIRPIIFNSNAEIPLYSDPILA